MNKHIKEKKRIRMSPKSAFTKEDLLFLKQFPRLYSTCSCLNISRTNIKKAYKRVVKYHSIDKGHFETTIKMILVHMQEKVGFTDGSYGEYYFNLYTKLGIMFKDKEGNIKLRCI